jgi:hypothetical protein
MPRPRYTAVRDVFPQGADEIIMRRFVQKDVRQHIPQSIDITDFVNYKTLLMLQLKQK